MRNFLLKLIKAKEDKVQELRASIKEAKTADEVRALGDTLDAVLSELDDAKKQLAELDDDGNSGDDGMASDDPDDGSRSKIPVDAQKRGINPLASFKGVNHTLGKSA